MPEPRIAGASSTKYGKHTESSSRELFSEAMADVYGNTEIQPDDVEAVYFGNFMGDLIEDQGHMGAMMADYAGVPDAASSRVESACVSGGVAFRDAYHAVKAGIHDVVVVGGTEIMYGVGTEAITDALANAADNEYENRLGLTFPGIYALVARSYMDEFGLTREELAEIAVKNRKNGSKNP
ncbi:MAG: beta-ketoacyl synthase N-terminal-like domain-containing protein, partial [Halobacteria archaeon]|nr:beta-ketoacyl synthase N-terminal-like domain-containing protein [Halobacteria archaeon]